MTKLPILLIAFVGVASAAERWTRIKSANFEVFTTSGEKRGREAVLHFEQVRGFFMTALASTGTPLPVRIIGFSSEKEFRPYRPTENAAAFYQTSRNRDYVVMSSLRSENYPVAVHEYVHLLNRHSGVPIPLWMNEGLAELYSTMTPSGEKVRVGDLIPGRYQALFSDKWLPLAAIFDVDHQSPLYNEKNRTGMFYAESWALMHMLNLDATYRAGFTEFGRALRTEPAADAFRKAYGKSVRDVEKDLQAYIRGSTFQVALFDIKLEKKTQEVEVSPADEIEVNISLADLMIGVNRTEARARYQKLSQDHPKRPEPFEGLGYLSLYDRDPDQALPSLAKAVELDTRNAEVYWDFARLARSKPGQKAQVIAAIDKLLVLAPAHVDARLMAGELMLRDQKYSQALAYLAPVKKITPQQAPYLFRALAYASWHVGDQRAAQTAAKRLLEVVPKEERADAERLYQAVNQPIRKDRPTTVVAMAPPPSAPQSAPAPDDDQEPGRPRIARRETPPPGTSTPVDPAVTMKGKLQHVECLDNRARLTVSVSGKALRFHIEDPNNIVIRSGAGGPLEFRCGPQQGQQVTVEFLPKDDLKNGTVGIVRALELQ